MTDDHQFVLASTFPPLCWNFYPTREAADAAAADANAYNVRRAIRSLNRTGLRLTGEDQV